MDASLHDAQREASSVTSMTSNDENGPLQSPVRALLELATLAVAASVDLEEIAPQFEYFPPQVSLLVLRHLQDDRMRHLERMLAAASSGAKSICFGAAVCFASFSVPGHEQDLQAEWKRRCTAEGLHVDAAISSDTLFRDTTPTTPTRDARRVYWEHRFRSFLRAEPAAAPIVSPSGDFLDHSALPDLTLYEDIVEALKVTARELIPRNVSWMLRLPMLRRLELHHPSDQLKTSMAGCLEVLVTQAPSLRELCFFHGRLAGNQVQRIADAIAKRVAQSPPLTPIHTVEVVSVKLKTKADHRQLVALFAQCRSLRSVRISSTITDFENRSLVSHLFSASGLTQLSLEHNDLEDNAFSRLRRAAATCVPRQPSALRHLRLGSNAISVASIRDLSDATLDGMLALERLELRNNQDIGDAGIHALAPMLAPNASRLTHLDVRNCHFGLEGALSLLSALRANATLRSLDLSQNFFGASIGDQLADFLLTNDALQRLHVNYVGLGQAGCTERLLLALRTNTSLRVLSVGANRLRNEGASRLMEAIVVRSRVVPYDAVDLSGNLVTGDGLHALTQLMEAPQHNDTDDSSDDEPAPKRRRVVDHAEQCQGPLLGELGLLNNDLAGHGDAVARTQAALRGLHRFVGVVHSNEWSGRRNVYDDEV